MLKPLVAGITSFLFLWCIAFFLHTSVTAAPPTNFQTTTIINTGLNGPSGFDIAPDGRVFILERAGLVKIYKNGSLLPTPFVNLPSLPSGDRGLIGIAFDPLFTSNKLVYFYYTGTDYLNHLVRVDATTDIGQNTTQIYQTTSPSYELHVGGSIAFGPDGKLYFAVGDNGYPPNAQDLANPHGKILRINKDGSIPLDNPFITTTGALPEIWAYGMRNPWRFQFDSATGFLYDGDVGNYTWEEMNRVIKGGNYGWPLCEGICPNPSFINPIFTYNHDGQSSAITAGPVYRSTQFPAVYTGHLFFGDYARGFIRTLELDASGNMVAVNDFDPTAGSVVDLKVAPDGSLYYITYYPGRLYRIAYTPGSSTPIVQATADKTGGNNPLTVNFSSAGSTDPDGDPINFSWTFGDGTGSTTPNPTKTYTTNGTYLAQLTISDGVNTAQSIPIVISVGTPPTLSIAQPTDGARYNAGDSISYQIFCTDAAGFDANDANLSTDILFHHDTHLHPFLGPLLGRANTFTIPTSGEPAANTWYEIKATCTDRAGLSTTKSVFIYPNTATLTFTTNPPGLPIYLDGTPYNTPYSVTGVIGYMREISVDTEVTTNGTTYIYNAWSDGGSQQHTITTPNGPRTYTAQFTASDGFTGQYYNNKTLAGNPTIIRKDPAIQFDWDIGGPHPWLSKDNYSVRWTKNQPFTGGIWRFTLEADDGIRLKIDGQTVIDGWKDQSLATYTTDIPLTAGAHDVVVEYYEAAGEATARLSWARIGDLPGQTMWQTQYFNCIDLCCATSECATSITTEESTINLHLAANERPHPWIAADNFSIRWTKTDTYTAGLYRINVSADDGIRVFVDGNQVINGWFFQSETPYSTDIQLTAGTHTIVVEYFEGAGEAVATFSITPTGTQPTSTPTPTLQPMPTPTNTPSPTPTPILSGPIWKAEYINCKWLCDQPPTIVRDEPEINLNLAGNERPHPWLAADNFSVRWTQTRDFAAGVYRFTVTSDDGSRLFVDGTNVIDMWQEQSETTRSIELPLTAGQHALRLEYFEAGAEAVARLTIDRIGDIPVNTNNLQPTTSQPTTSQPTPLPASESTSTPSSAPANTNTPDSSPSATQN